MPDTKPTISSRLSTFGAIIPSCYLAYQGRRPVLVAGAVARPSANSKWGHVTLIGTMRKAG